MAPCSRATCGRSEPRRQNCMNCNERQACGPRRSPCVRNALLVRNRSRRGGSQPAAPPSAVVRHDSSAGVRAGNRGQRPHRAEAWRLQAGVALVALRLGLVLRGVLDSSFTSSAVTGSTTTHVSSGNSVSFIRISLVLVLDPQKRNLEMASLSDRADGGYARFAATRRLRLWREQS